MRVFVVFCLIGAAVAHTHQEETYEDADIRDPALRQEFKQFITKFRGSGNLRSNSDVRQRFRVFAHNAKKIKVHNKQHKGWRMDINKFADKTVRERLAFTGLANVTNALKAEKRARRSVLHLRQAAPEAYDHRDEGHVTKVTNQGNCGSCWSYGTVYPVEGALSIASGQPAKELSQQQVLSCTYESDSGRNGCNGGWYMEGWDYLIKSGHLTYANDDPYLGIDLACDPDILEKPNAFKKFKVTGYSRVPRGDDSALAVASSQNVVAIALESIGLFFYSDGLFYDDGCASPAEVDHAVTLVGYNKEGWIVKNSWGEDWGEKGYVRMSRQLKNHCGISDYAYYPEVDEVKEE